MRVIFSFFSISIRKSFAPSGVFSACYWGLALVTALGVISRPRQFGALESCIVYILLILWKKGFGRGKLLGLVVLSQLTLGN